MCDISSSCNLSEQPKLRFPGFVGAWEQKEIGDVFAERSERGAVHMELLSVTMNEGVVPRTDMVGKDNSSEDKSNYKIVCKGDVVYNSMRMWQGANGVSLYNGIVSPAYTVLRPIREISTNYFAAFFKTPNLVEKFRKNSQGLTSDTWNLKFPQIKTIPVKIADLHEQQKIADFLQLIDQRIEKQRTLVETLKKYKRGLLEDIFNRPDNNWQTVKLRNLCSKIGSGKTPKGGASVYSNVGGIMLLRSQNILWGNLDTDDVAFISNKVDEEMQSSRVEKNDILLNITGASIGRCCHYTLMLPANVNQHVCIIRINNNLISPKFLLQQMLSYIAQKQIDNCQNGGSREGLNFQQIGNFDILVPPISLQHQIENILFNVDLRIQGEIQLLVSALKIKDGMLQQLFI